MKKILLGLGISIIVILILVLSIGMKAVKDGFNNQMSENETKVNQLIEERFNVILEDYKYKDITYNKEKNELIMNVADNEKANPKLIEQQNYIIYKYLSENNIIGIDIILNLLDKDDLGKIIYTSKL